MSTQRVEVELDVPDGWEATSEYRPPRDGERFLSHDIQLPVQISSGGLGRRRFFIIRRKEPPHVKLARLSIPLLKSVGINSQILSSPQLRSVEAVELAEQVLAEWEKSP